MKTESLPRIPETCLRRCLAIALMAAVLAIGTSGCATTRQESCCSASGGCKLERRTDGKTVQTRATETEIALVPEPVATRQFHPFWFIWR